MIRIAVVGDIGSGKSHIAKLFNYPVFNADFEVAKIYKTNKKCFKNLKTKLPKYFSSFPIKKKEIIEAIVDKETNLKKITNIIHPEIRKKMDIFIKDNKKENIVILDVPLFFESRLNKKGDIIIFIQSKKTEIIKRLKKRNNFNLALLNKFKKIQLSKSFKKNKSHYCIKNNFTNKSAKLAIKKILIKIFIK
jgi:dephospho-CoA kinase